MLLLRRTPTQTVPTMQVRLLSHSPPYSTRQIEPDKFHPSPAMDVDSKKTSKARIDKKRIGKRKAKKSKIVFPKYSDRAGKKKGGK